MPVSKDSVFFNTRVKIERAKQHVRELDEELGEYLKTKPFKVVVEKDPDSENHLWTIRVKNEVPGNLSEIIGDTFHKLSTSLDLLAADLVLMAGGDAKDVHFPYASGAGGLDKAIKRSNIDRAGDEIVEIVRALKPYNGGNELLRAFHELDLTDGLKALTASVHYTGLRDIKVSRSGDPVLEVDRAHCGPIRDGMVIMSLPPASSARPGKIFLPLLRITFDEDPLLSGKDIVEALNGAVFLTEEVVRIFVVHLQEKGAIEVEAPASQ